MSAERSQRAALATVVVVCLAVLVIFQAVVAVRSARRTVGFVFDERPDGLLVSYVVPRQAAERGGLRKGDLLLRVGGHRITTLTSYKWAAQDFRRGHGVLFEIRRQGDTRVLTLSPGAPFPWLIFLLNACNAIGYTSVALLALQQNPRLIQSRLLFGFGVAVAAEFCLPEPVGQPWVSLLSYCGWYALTGLQIGLELHLSSLIPDRPAWLRARPWVVPLYYVIGLGLGAAGFATYLSESLLGAPLFPWTFVQVDSLLRDYGLPIWGLAVCLLLGSRALRHPEPRGRHQAGLVLAGTLPWLVLSTTFSVRNQLDLPPFSWYSAVEALALLCYPVAMIAAIFRYHLFDIELAVRRSLIYTALSSTLVLLFYAAVGAGGALLPAAVQGHDSMWAVAVATLLLGLLFAPLRRLLHGVIDRRFFPERYALRQRLVSLAGELPALGKLPRMGRYLVARVSEIFGSSAATLLIANPEARTLSVLATSDTKSMDPLLVVAMDDPAVELVQRADRALLASQVQAKGSGFVHRLPQPAKEGLLVPLRSNDRLIGLLSVGAKADRTAYPAEEMDLLTLLAHHVATVFENARLFESATYEALTGLLRREAILEQLDRELERAQRYERPLTIAMADLDYFKEVNDRYGHLAGDALLRRLSQVTASGLRSTDWIGRYGGEEFLLILPETDIEGAVRVAEKVRSLVQRTAVPMEDGSAARVTISIGLASLPRAETVTARDLIGAADRSLYEAKNGGRNRVHPLLVA